MTGLYRFGRGLTSALFHVLYPYRVVHPVLQESGRMILCANHISLKDPMFLAYTQKRQVYYMAKSELFRTKVLAFLLRKVGAFPVMRGKGDTGAFRNAGEVLAQEDILGIFPEGTRSKDGEMQHGKPGIAMLAYQNQAPVYPVAIVSRTPHAHLFHRVLIVCGAPIPFEQLNIREGSNLEYRNATRLIMQRIAALREEGQQLLGLPGKKTNGGKNA